MEGEQLAGLCGGRGLGRDVRADQGAVVNRMCLLNPHNLNPDMQPKPPIHVWNKAPPTQH